MKKYDGIIVNIGASDKYISLSDATTCIEKYIQDTSAEQAEYNSLLDYLENRNEQDIKAVTDLLLPFCHGVCLYS